MEYQEIKKLVEYFEDRIIINFEKHFNQLVIMDFYEGGYNDRIEDEFFYNEYFEKYEKGVVDLLMLIENEFSDEYQDFKFRLIKMKRVIDNHLTKINDAVVIENFKHTRNTQFLLNQNLNTKTLINSLYNQLNNNKLIDIDLEDFKNHFNDNWNVKIKWLGTELQITNLINLLIKNDVLDKETSNNKYLLIKNHFVNKNNKPFNPKQLGAVYSEKNESIPKDDIIYKIIEEISTHL
ncbi:hypothetical protein [Flavobacterium macrobrachii]|uniref:RteC protein n=1 Tax=Flavobacterium macrobrachii TaxID=591204 RepID=A0ABS2CYZ7_9FLAO|nr:hypothetical protein [Flavobacterium macrobrachii]MBM6500197.1 hypothetical protein [Flavobacterium macrobrachii]